MGWLYMFNNWKKKVQPRKGKLSWKFATFSGTKMGKTWHSRKATHRHAQLQIGYQDGSSFIIGQVISNTLNIFKKHLSKSKGKSSSTTFSEVNMKKNLVWYYTNHRHHSLLRKKKHIVHPVPATHPGCCRTGGAWCGAGCCVGGRMCHSDAKPLQFSSFQTHLAICVTHFYGTMELEIWNT